MEVSVMVKKSRDRQSDIPSPVLDETIPHQIDAPTYKGSGISMQKPFVNRYGIVIGDSQYNSLNSPLNHWSDEIDPATMAGDEWVHPTNDIGWNTKENKELIEGKIKPKGVPFQHPMQDATYRND